MKRHPCPCCGFKIKDEPPIIWPVRCKCGNTLQGYDDALACGEAKESKPCGCNKRQRKLNKAGAYIGLPRLGDYVAKGLGAIGIKKKT